MEGRSDGRQISSGNGSSVVIRGDDSEDSYEIRHSRLMN